MPEEIERKFLVKTNLWEKPASVVFCRQGYLSTEKNRIVRVRVAGKSGFITVKGLSEGVSRLEFEYEIPLADAENILEKLCKKPLIEKKRYTVQQGEIVWEIDEFSGENEGLVIAEVELENESQEIDLPEWIDREVSGEPKYFNANLVKCPYKNW